MRIVPTPGQLERALGTTGLLSLAGSFLLAGAACNKIELQTPSEVEEVSSSTVQLPEVPNFNEPKPYPDNTHSVREMRLKGDVYIDTEVDVKGYVVWIYDCGSTIRTPEMTDKELQKILEDEPQRCDRPNFVIADEANQPPDKGIWIVESPRALRKDEKRSMTPERKEMERMFKEMPKFEPGDQVVVSGDWKLSSPAGFQNSNGLLVYKKMSNLSTETETAGK